MNRPVVLAVLVGALVGVLGGFLWWGMPTGRMHTELGQARERAATLERDADEAQARARQAEEALRRAEQELTMEREQRTRLEMHLSRGRK